MTTEDHLKLIIGDLAFQLAVLRAQLQEEQAKKDTPKEDVPLNG